MESKISEKIYYIGVNGRTTHRFESLWPIPSGISYNSYLISGDEKSAIIDGVETGNALSKDLSVCHAIGVSLATG